MVEYEVTERIFAVPKGKTMTIELNKVKWGNNEEKFDLRVWKEDGPMKGFTMSDEELLELCNEMAQFAGCIIEE